MSPVVKKSKLENGLRLVTESVPGRASVHLGLHLLWGSRNEKAGQEGAAHLIEHMVFKGTQTRSAYSIVKEIEAVGGDIGASTGKEMTSYTVQCLTKDVGLGVDLLSDLVLNAEFKEEDYEKEREVVISEIAMSQENFEESVFDFAFEDIFKGHSLGKAITGTAESIKSISCQELFAIYQEHYNPKNMVFTVSGDVEHDEIKKHLEKHFKAEKKNFADLEPLSKGAFQPSTRFVEKNSEQAHLLMSFPAPAFSSEDRLKSYIANTALGGGMTSLLYQKVREEKALAYSVYSYLQCFLKEGVLSIYVGTKPQASVEVLGLVTDEIQNLVKKGMSLDQLDLYREQLLGEVLMSQDDLEERMNSLAINELVFGRYRSPEEVVQEIKQISLEEMSDYFKKYFDTEPSVIILGPKV